MGKKTLFGASMLAVSMMMGAGTASATAGDCAAELIAVGSAIDAGVYLGKRAATSESNLQAKLEAADAKVSLDKFSDAVDKLMNISDTATALADAPKAKLEDATDINDAVSAAIICVGNVGAL